MTKYIIKRLIYMFITLFFIITVTFFLMHIIPGDPLSYMAQNLPEQARLNYYAKYGLDKPIFEQYVIFLKNLMQGNMGESLRYPGRSVSEVVYKTGYVSGQAGMISLILGFFIGIIFGIITAIKKNSFIDYLLTILAIAGITIPIFVLGALFQYIFTVKYPYLPTTGWGTIKHAIIPVVVLSLSVIATYTRYMKASVLEVLNQDYILTAKAKGVSQFNIIRKHVLRNAILPSITILGQRIVIVFTGGFVIERMFRIPGLGFYFVTAITDRDYTMILGNTIFYAALFIIVQLIIDIIYVLIDPRIKIS